MCGIAGERQSRHAGFSRFVPMRSPACTLQVACAAACLADARFYGQAPLSSGTLAAGLRALHDLVQFHNVNAGAHHGRSLSQ